MKQSYFDLQAAKLSFENGFNEWAAYQSEQSAEKVLKAYIVYVGFRPPKLHKLSILVSMANKVECSYDKKISNKFRNLDINFKTLQAFTFISRYPFVIPGERDAPHEYITFEDAQICIDEASDLFTKVTNLINEQH